MRFLISDTDSVETQSTRYFITTKRIIIYGCIILAVGILVGFLITYFPMKKKNDDKDEPTFGSTQTTEFTIPTNPSISTTEAPVDPDRIRNSLLRNVNENEIRSWLK